MAAIRAMEGGFGEGIGSHGSMMARAGRGADCRGRGQENRAIWRILFIASSAATLYASAKRGVVEDGVDEDS